MHWNDIPFRPSSRTLRQFAGLWLLFFAGLAAWQGFHSDNWTAAALLGATAITIGPLGLAVPQFLRPLFVGWMILAFPVGWVVSRILLAGVFYGVVTPIGVIMRLLGWDALARRRQPGMATYWIPKPTAEGARSYFRQY